MINFKVIIEKLYSWLESSTIAHIVFYIISAILFIRWFVLIDAYSVNVLFYDQWDFFNPLFNSEGLIELFTYQHGPHRQGIGMWIIALANELSAWDTKVDAMVLGVFSTLSAISILLLKYKIIGKHSFFDIIIFLICLSPLQHGIFTNTPNISHGVLPLFLISIFGWSLMLKSTLVRYSVILLLDLLLIYTGFGFFMGMVIPMYFLLERSRNQSKAIRRLSVVSFIISLFLLGSFFISYDLAHFYKSVPVEDPNIIEYPLFFLYGISKIFGLNQFVYLPIAICGIMMILIFAKFFKLFKRLFIKNTALNDYNSIIVILSFGLFSIIYFMVTSLGRAKYGLESVRLTTRYFPLLIPLYISVYFIVVKYMKRTKIILFVGLLGMFIVSFHYPVELSQMNHFKQIKTNWIEVYLNTNSIEKANNCDSCLIYPKERIEKTDLYRKTEFLKVRKLNLFKTNKEIK